MTKKSSSSVRKNNGTAMLAVLVKIKPPNICNMYARAYINNWSFVASAGGS
jgi:hypothetical protein